MTVRSDRQPAVLLMRMSPAQVYCANTLFGHGAIDRVFVEEGSVGEPTGWALAKKLGGYGPRGVARRIARDLSHFDGNPLRCADYYRTRLSTRSLMNRQVFHEARILGSAGRRLDERLPVVRGSSVNSEACLALIRDGGYRPLDSGPGLPRRGSGQVGRGRLARDAAPNVSRGRPERAKRVEGQRKWSPGLARGAPLVFVFGTGLLRPRILSESGATFVNLHWGLAPRYRGEGIISALTQEGVRGLGLTVHIIDEGIDSGPILYQERLVPDLEDNVYAIGLRLSVLGARLFLRVSDDVSANTLRASPQSRTGGRLCLSRQLKTDYWKLRKAQEVLAAYRAGLARDRRARSLAPTA